MVFVCKVCWGHDFRDMVGHLPAAVEMHTSTLLRLLNFPEENKMTLLASDE